MELNRENIIKALECCLVESNCTGCPLHHQYEIDCLKYAGVKALSLIKELTVEVADLKAIAEGYRKQFEDCYEENERLREKADRNLENLKAVLDERSESTIIADTVRKMQDKVIPIIESLVEMMWDDNEANCIVESCNKPDSIGCGNRICIDENKALWVAKIDQIAEEMVGGDK